MDGRPSYLKAAFANVYNLGLLGGSLVASGLTGEYALGAIAVLLESLWLLFAPDVPGFRRLVDRAQREARFEQEEKDLVVQTQQLPQREWARAHALNQLRKDIEKDMQHNPSFQALLLKSEVDKLLVLLKSFVSLAGACSRAESYLALTDPKDLAKQIDVQRKVEAQAEDPTARQIASKNIQVLERRQKTIHEIQNFLARGRGQMNLIENSVRLLRDQVLTMADPDQLGDQLDDLITGVESIQESAKDHAAIFQKIAQVEGPPSTEDRTPDRARS